jgi:chemotaxis protein histidine kinase CheA
MAKTRGEMHADDTLISAVVDFRPRCPVLPPEADPVARAEAAVAGLSNRFTGWIEQQAAELGIACAAALAKGKKADAAEMEKLLSVAHDLKGLSATLGFPLAGHVANGICRLIEAAQAGRALPHGLVRQHVEAIRAIVREGARGNDHATARELAARLMRLTDAALA